MAGVLAIALALIASVGPRPVSPLLAPDPAAATDCTWQRQVKRVVKRVRRHGKVRRVVRRKVRWVCVPQTAAPVVAPTQTPPPPTPPEPEEPEANRLGVRADDFYFILSRPSVKAGSLPVELNNQGEDPHNLNIRPEDDEGEPLQIPETGPEQRTVVTFNLPAGKYRLWCSLPEHEEKGMVATLQVE